MGNQFNTIKKKIPNYLENEILKIILDYLLIKNQKKENEIKKHYSKKRFFRYNREIITYSLVSKKWFQFISNIVSNNIIENDTLNKWIFCRNKEFDINNIGFKLKDRLKQYNLSINKVNSIINIDKQLINNYFKDRILIIHANDIGDDYLKSMELIKEYNENNSILLYDKIIIDNVQGCESISSESELLLNTISKLISKDQINNQEKLIIDIEWLTSEKWENIHRDRFGLSNKIFKTNKLTIKEYNGNYDSRFGIIHSLQPKKIKIKEYYDDYDEIPSYNYSPLFKTDNNRLESIEIREGWVNVGHLNKIDISLPNLHTLSISILLHEIIKSILKVHDNHHDGLGDCFYNLIGNREIDSEENDLNHWEIMINSLSNCKSLKNLSINCFCSHSNDECFSGGGGGGGDFKFINSIFENVILNGFIKILKSEINNIQYLSIGFDLNLNGYPDQSIDFFKSLESNLKLKTLSFNNFQLPNSIINYLFSNLFKINNSINHLIIYNSEKCNLIFKYLLLNYNFYNSLYSITLFIESHLILKEILNHLNQFKKKKKNNLNQFSSSLKEFNLHLFLKDPDNEIIKNLKNNKSFIINLIFS
ncbi:hypothetical protein ACTA71_010907 [Dictyostelium dimigraforme]